MSDPCTPLTGSPLGPRGCPRPSRVLPCLLLLVFCLAIISPAAQAASKLVAMKSGQPCLDCHGKLNKQKNIHPATEGGDGCATLCHEQGDPALHRFAAPPNPIGPLCLGCHDTVVLKLDIHQHPPVADGDCTACHDPHQSDRAKLLNGPYPETFYQTYSEAAYGLCLNCHDAAAFKAPRTTTATAFRNGDLNLHQRHVNKKKGRSCKACHDMHGSRQSHLIASAFRFGERGLAIAYETTDNGGSCVTSCHVKVSYDRLTPVNNPLRTSPRPGESAAPEKSPQTAPRKKK